MARILIVEDEPVTRQMLREMLERAGHAVSEAPDATQGMRICRSNPPDLLVTDMIMPGKPGWEAILELRNEFPGLKAIGISAGGQVGPFGCLMLAKRFGAKRVLIKPIRHEELLQAVDQVLSDAQPDSRGAKRQPKMCPQKKTILVLDGDTRHSWNLCETVTRAGHIVTDTTTVEHALELVNSRSFEAAILDVAAMQPRDKELMGLLRKSWTHPLIVAIADFNTIAVKKLVINRGADHFLSKPVDVDEFLDLLFPEPAFKGQLEGFDLLEYLQFILLTGKKTVVQLQSAGGNSCSLYCSNGQIVHAVCGPASGEDAFFRSIEFKGGDPDQSGLGGACWIHHRQAG